MIVLRPASVIKIVLQSGGKQAVTVELTEGWRSWGERSEGATINVWRLAFGA